MKLFAFPDACSVQATRALQPTRKIVVKGALDVEFRCADRPALIVAGETADAVATVRTYYEGDKLVIEREGITIAVGGSVMVFHGSVGSIVMGDTVNGQPTGAAVSLRHERVVVGLALPESPHVKLKGSGGVSLHDLQQASIELEVSGSGEIVATGKVENLAVRLAGSGDVEAGQLTAERADLAVSGSGNIVAYVKAEVRARVTGSGNVEVRGNPPRRDHRVTGSGDIRFR